VSDVPARFLVPDHVFRARRGADPLGPLPPALRDEAGFLRLVAGLRDGDAACGGLLGEWPHAVRRIGEDLVVTAVGPNDVVEGQGVPRVARPDRSGRRGPWADAADGYSWELLVRFGDAYYEIDPASVRTGAGPSRCVWSALRRVRGSPELFTAPASR
jgi:hypothetical protein